MTKKRSLKRLVRERMAKTGETYQAALRHVLAKANVLAGPMPPSSPPPEWHSLVQTTPDEARELIACALEREPLTTHFGIGVYKGGGWQQASCDELDRQRENLQAALLEVAACADWIKEQRPIKSLNRRHSSYGYKHKVERWIRGRGGHLYVANGSFIAAAIGMGFKFQLSHPGSPNCFFNFSERSVKALAV